MGEERLLIQAGSGQSVGWGLEGPSRLLGRPLSNSMERANPSIFTAGPPSKDGCQMLRSSAKKTNKGTFKNSRVKGCFFSSSASDPHAQLMISFPLSQEFKLWGVGATAGFSSRFHFPCMWQFHISGAVPSADFPSDAAGSLTPSSRWKSLRRALGTEIRSAFMQLARFTTGVISYPFIHFKPAKGGE